MNKIDNKKQGKFLAIFVIGLLFLDQLTKIIFYLKGNIIIQDENMQTNNGYYIIMSIIIVLMILRYIQNDNTYIKFGTKMVLCFAVAGAIGNVIDRIWNKNVIMFIKITDSFSINLAYIYIILTWILMAGILTKNSIKFLEDKKNKKLIQEEFEKNKHLIKDIKNEKMKGNKNENKSK